MEKNSNSRLLFSQKGGDLMIIIQNILVRLPVKSLLRLKDVSPTWCNLIESSSFIDLHTTVTTFKSSSSRFGSFIVHPAVESQRFRKTTLLVLSSESESECVSESSKSWCSGSFGLWSSGFNGFCGRCDSSGGLRWSTNDDGYCSDCFDPNPYNRVAAEVDNNNNNTKKWSYNDDDQKLVLKLDNLGFPSSYQFDKKIRRPIYIVGSCNGLICLYDEQPNEVSLWNPATRQFRILPKSSSKPIGIGDGDGDGDGEITPHRLLAFGFDDETKDYKVVLLSFFNRRRTDDDGPVLPMECICRVEVYSLSTDSWSILKGIKVLPGSPYYPYPSDSSGLFYLNGSCLFIAKLIYSERSYAPDDIDDRFIISLDLTKEIIIPIKLPKHHRFMRLYLCYLGNKIALFTKTYVYNQVYDVNDPNCSWEAFRIWVFDELRTSSVDVDYLSWRKLHEFGINIGIRGEMNIPRGISNDGVFALLETDQLGGLGNKKKKMRLYNLVTNKLKRSFLSCDQVLSKVYAYKPSLVSTKHHQPIGY